MNRIAVIFLIIFFPVLTIHANPDDLFSYNSDKVAEELSLLEEIENWVTAHPEISLADLQSANPDLLNGLTMSCDISDTFNNYDNGYPLGIPPFIWGCCFGIIGVAIVYAEAEDSSETRSALIGCAISSLLGVGIIIVYYVLIFYNVYTWWYW